MSVKTVWLPVDLVPQKKETWCIPACMEMVGCAMQVDYLESICPDEHNICRSQNELVSALQLGSAGISLELVRSRLRSNKISIPIIQDVEHSVLDIEGHIQKVDGPLIANISEINTGDPKQHTVVVGGTLIIHNGQYLYILDPWPVDIGNAYLLDHKGLARSRIAALHKVYMPVYGRLDGITLKAKFLHDKQRQTIHSDEGREKVKQAARSVFKELQRDMNMIPMGVLTQMFYDPPIEKMDQLSLADPEPCCFDFIETERPRNGESCSGWLVPIRSEKRTHGALLFWSSGAENEAPVLLSIGHGPRVSEWFNLPLKNTEEK